MAYGIPIYSTEIHTLSIFRSTSIMTLSFREGVSFKNRLKTLCPFPLEYFFYMSKHSTVIRFVKHNIDTIYLQHSPN